MIRLRSTRSTENHMWWLLKSGIIHLSTHKRRLKSGTFSYFMLKHRQVYVILIETGSLVKDLHYGPFSRFWWEFPCTSTLSSSFWFPIRIGQKTQTCLNEHDFYITIQLSSSQPLPEYFCQSGDFFTTETSSIKAVSKVYQNIFRNETQYSGPIIIGWNN